MLGGSYKGSYDPGSGEGTNGLYRAGGGATGNYPKKEGAHGMYREERGTRSFTRKPRPAPTMEEIATDGGGRSKAVLAKDGHD